MNILDQQDGTYLVRYRIHENSLSSYKLIVKITRSSDNFVRLIYLNSSITNECICPEKNLSNWYEKMSCNFNYSQIEFDLKKFASIDMNLAGKLIINAYNKEYSQSLCNYAIVNNQVINSLILNFEADLQAY